MLDLEIIKGRLARSPAKRADEIVEKITSEAWPDASATEAWAAEHLISEAIAEAHTDIAALAAEVERLREEIEDAGNEAIERGERFL